MATQQAEARKRVEAFREAYHAMKRDEDPSPDGSKWQSERGLRSACTAQQAQQAACRSRRE